MSPPPKRSSTACPPCSTPTPTACTGRAYSSSTPRSSPSTTRSSTPSPPGWGTSPRRPPGSSPWPGGWPCSPPSCRATPSSRSRSPTWASICTGWSWAAPRSHARAPPCAWPAGCSAMWPRRPVSTAAATRPPRTPPPKPSRNGWAICPVCPRCSASTKSRTPSPPPPAKDPTWPDSSPCSPRSTTGACPRSCARPGAWPERAVSTTRCRSTAPVSSTSLPAT